MEVPTVPDNDMAMVVKEGEIAHSMGMVNILSTMPLSGMGDTDVESLMIHIVDIAEMENGVDTVGDFGNIVVHNPATVTATFENKEMDEYLSATKVM